MEEPPPPLPPPRDAPPEEGALVIYILPHVVSMTYTLLARRTGYCQMGISLTRLSFKRFFLVLAGMGEIHVRPTPRSEFTGLGWREFSCLIAPSFGSSSEISNLGSRFAHCCDGGVFAGPGPPRACCLWGWWRRCCRRRSFTGLAVALCSLFL